MRSLYAFMMVSLDGSFEGPNHDLSWHQTDSEFVSFALEQLAQVGTILFGRRTYEMMASFWPTDQAKDDPETAQFMNTLPKVVFSSTLKEATWNATELVNTSAIEKVKSLKEGEGKTIAVFGSNKLLVSLAEAGLVDEFRLMINPIAIGKGTALFTGIKEPLELKLLRTREFQNGNVLLTYQPERK